MNDKLRILIIAYYFPPDSSSGALRPFFFANHLREMGAEVTVLTARESDFLPEQPKDQNLAALVHKDIEVIRARARRPREALLFLTNRMPGRGRNELLSFSPGQGDGQTVLKSKSFLQNIKDTVTDLLASPDPQVGWIPDVVRRGNTLIKNKEINVIWATGSPWSCLIAGVLLRRKTKVPLALDFRDPWVANPGFIQRGRIACFLEQRMERMVVSRTDKLIANTEELRENFIARFPFLKADDVYSIPNGFEKILSSEPPRNKCFTLTHAGALYFSRTPVFLLEALYQLLIDGLIPEDDISLVFVGGISIDDDRVKKLLEMPILNKSIQIIPRVSYEEALKYQLKSDALFLIQPNFPLQAPRKLYEYMALRRPILAITEEAGATAGIVNKYQLGKVVNNEVSSIKSALLEMYQAWKKSSDTILTMTQVNDFKNSVLTERLYAILRQTANQDK